ncbi:hypothetical protein AAFF_G00438540 [Aldrovandia affinis]|uniref:Beta-galactoside alpha-2,6-sialyltransferase 1 n=1 Tax=Aldrovandia affinis TaxID=143900 RepID=A0AAD7S873_9TELE|nr:hypothetical protein AAFF_G00438540 [Aldrovandia affinis]
MEFRKKHLLAFFVTAVICVLSYIFYGILQTVTPSKEWLYSRIAGTAAVTSIRCKPHFREGVASPLPQIVPGKQWSIWNKFSTAISKEVLESVRTYRTTNKFHVSLNLTRRNSTLSKGELLCELKVRVPFGTIKAGDGPFSGGGWENILPNESLAETLGLLKTCAVVMSSGSIRNSTLGTEIDSHDAVLRFNSAPTKGHSVDVGNRTTLRIINSQLMMSKTDGFLTDPLYNTGVLMVWDPAPYSRDLYAWYRKPDFDFFQTYKDYRRLHPQQPFYILSPSMQWDLWDVIQENTPTDIQPNPPSSGMLGIAVMMNLCEKISVYEFLPSHRKTDLCHYFQNIHNRQCTVGHYHPLTFEKNLVKGLNLGSHCDIYTSGKVTMCGFSQKRCPYEL